MNGFKNITEVKKANKAIGHHWFDRDTIEYHGSKVETPVMGGFYWVESAWKNAADKFDFDHHANLSPDDYELGRAYRAVGASPDGAVQYLYGAERFPTLQSAIRYITGIIESRES